MVLFARREISFSPQAHRTFISCSWQNQSLRKSVLSFIQNSTCCPNQLSALKSSQPLHQVETSFPTLRRTSLDRNSPKKVQQKRVRAGPELLHFDRLSACVHQLDLRLMVDMPSEKSYRSSQCKERMKALRYSSKNTVLRSFKLRESQHCWMLHSQFWRTRQRRTKAPWWMILNLSTFLIVNLPQHTCLKTQPLVSRKVCLRTHEASPSTRIFTFLQPDTKNTEPVKEKKRTAHP